MDDDKDLPPEETPAFPGPTAGTAGEDFRRPLCPGCDRPMKWVEEVRLWQCHLGGPHFVDEDGYDVDPDDVPKVDCILCGEWVARHADGCPNGSPEMAQCGECGDLLPVSELADHMNDVHDAGLSREDIEQSFVEAKEMARELLGQVRSHQHRLKGIPIVEIWAAVGYHLVNGRWPDEAGFTAEDALPIAMREFAAAAANGNSYLRELRALKAAVGHDPDLPYQPENIDLAAEPAPPGFIWDEQQGWLPHCPYGCSTDQPCPHRPRGDA